MKLRLKIHPAGAALAALGLLLLPSAGMLAAAAAMALHEGGHVLAMALCGVRECRIELTPPVAALVVLNEEFQNGFLLLVDGQRLHFVCPSTTIRDRWVKELEAL